MAGVASSAMLLIVILVCFGAKILKFGAGFIKVLARRRDPDLVASS